MNDILKRIKRAVIAGNVVFTDKATTERERDGLTEEDVIESILNAVAIYKTIKSTHSRRRQREYLHVIQSTNLDGLVIYSKGKLVVSGGIETYYVLVSAKTGRIARYAPDQDMSDLWQPANPKGETNPGARVPGAAIRRAGTGILRMSELWGAALRPRGFTEDRAIFPCLLARHATEIGLTIRRVVITCPLPSQEIDSHLRSSIGVTFNPTGPV